MQSQERLVRVSVALAIVTLVARLLNGALQIVVAAIFGASGRLDAYLVGASIPTAITEWFMLAAPAVVLVPLVISLRSDGQDDEAWRLTCAFGNLLLLFVGVLLVVSLLFGPQLVGVLAPGIPQQSRDLAVTVLRLTMLALLPTAMAGMARALLQTRHRFLAPAVAGVASSLTMIASALLLYGQLDVYALAVGSLLGAILSLVVVAHSARDLRGRYYFGIDVPRWLAHRSTKLLAAFLVIGTAAQINFLSDRFFASYLPQGSISILSYGEKLASFLMMIFATAVAVPAYSAFSATIAEKDMPALKETIVSSLRLIAAITLPVLVFSVLLRGPLIRLLLLRGVFTAGDAEAVATVFAYLCGVFFIYAFGQILTYAFFALQETGRFLAVVVAGIALNIILDVVLVGPLGVPGLAIATLTATAVSNSVCWWMLGRRLGGLGARAHLGFAAKVTAAAIASGAVAYVVTVALTPTGDTGGTLAQAARLAGAAACGGAAYVAVCRLLRVSEITGLWQLARGKFRPA